MYEKFYVHEKIVRNEIAINLSNIYFLKNIKKTCNQTTAIQITIETKNVCLLSILDSYNYFLRVISPQN